MNPKHLYSLLLFILLGFSTASAQTVVYGQITDAQSQEPVAFANIIFKGTQIGTTSDFEGNYRLSTTEKHDSIEVLFIGYTKKSKAVIPGREQKIDFQLEPAEFTLAGVEINPGKNPAHRILRNVWDKRDQNDMKALESYQYESYTKVQVDVDNISDKFRNKTIMRPFAFLFDSLDMAAGEDGRPVLPIFISETISDLYVQANPKQKKEHIKATNVTGVGVDDGDFISQFVGSSLHDYNFYKNNLTILEHNVVSPISTEAIGFYVHILEDSLWIGNKWCYQIKLVPKRKEDLAFNGTIWVQDTSWALVKLSVEVTGDANLNFIDRFKIQQEFEPTEAGPWLPSKTRILMDVAQPTKGTFGMLAKVYISNKDIIVNEEYDEKFFKRLLTVDIKAQDHDQDFWKKNRHEKLSNEDLGVHNMINSVKSFPKIKSYIEIAKAITSGYIKLTPKLEFGSYLLTYGSNPVERHRFRVGLRTTEEFSKKVVFSGYTAYGLKDQRLKYGFKTDYFISRKTWTKVGYEYKNDLEGLGATNDFEDSNPLLSAASQLGFVGRLNKINMHRVWFQTDLHKAFSQKVILTSKYLVPRGDFIFAYHPELGDERVKSDMHITELAFETRWAPKETKLNGKNNRVTLNANKAPAFTARYTIGLKDVLDGSFNYHRFDFKINQIARLGIFGRGEYILQYSKIFTPLPYPLLNIFPGNETFIRSMSAFNLMDFFEFVADESFMAFYVHHFDGLVMNRIPLMRKLKWRLVLSGKAATGNLSDRNAEYLASHDANGKEISSINSMDPSKPYYEVGYGFENILRFIRIQAFHRLSYTEGRKSNFGVKGSVYFNF